MGPKILLADDEDGVRWVLEKGLREAGYEVTSVEDGAAALRQADAEPRRAHRARTPAVESARRARDRHDGARDDGDRDPGDATRGVRLSCQALRHRRSAAAHRTRARRAAP